MDDVPEMVARVARAMCSAAMIDPDWSGDPETGEERPNGTPAWRDKVALARAAIAAMREPLPDMTYVGPTFASGDILGEREDNAAEIWRSMTDAALTAPASASERGS